MSQLVPPLARRIFSRGVLIAIIGLCVLGVLGSLLFGLMAMDAQLATSTEMELQVMAQGLIAPDLPLPDGVWAEYTRARIIDGNSPAQPLLTVAAVLPCIGIGVTCAMVLVIAVCILRGEPFGLGVVISMLTIALICIGSGFARPWLLVRAKQLFIEALALPTNGQGVPAWVERSVAPSLADADWTLILLGLLAGIGAWLILRVRQLRLDLEGTI